MKNKLLMAIIILMLSLTVQADEIEEQINLGLKNYQSKEYNASIEELKFAITQIQELLNGQNAKLLPEPLDGWTSSDVENNSAGMAMMGGGTQLTKTYQKQQQTIEISITAGSPMMAGVMALMSNPMMMSSNPQMKPYRYQRYKGVKEIKSESIEITLSLAGQIMVKIDANNSSEQVINQYLDKIDFKKIQAAFLQ